MVSSCQHIPSERSYQVAKELCQEQFGNEYRIAAAYTDKALAWLLVKAEDVKALQAFSVFVRGCDNLIEKLLMPTNTRAILTFSFEIQGKRGQRHVLQSYSMF